MTPLCPFCYRPLVPNYDGEWLRCPKGHVLDIAAEDALFPQVIGKAAPAKLRSSRGEPGQ
jgi:hypothetical protein